MSMRPYIYSRHSKARNGRTPTAKTCVSIVATLPMLVLTCSASTIINTYPDWQGLTTVGWPVVAQSFTVPADNTLLNYTTSMSPTNTHPLLFQIYLWNTNSGPVGSPLFSEEVPWPKNGELQLTNINLTLSTGVRYATVMDFEGFRGSSLRIELNQNNYPQGNASWSFGSGLWADLEPGYNTVFRAEFVTIPEPSSISVLSAGLLAVAASIRHREKPMRSRDYQYGCLTPTVRLLGRVKRAESLGKTEVRTAVRV